MARSACKWCAAPVEWYETVAGRQMPVDVAPVEGGNVRLVTVGRRQLAEVMTVDQLARHRGPRYTSHLATCPASSLHRRRGPGHRWPAGSSR